MIIDFFYYFYIKYYPTTTFLIIYLKNMVEPLLSGIVLGLVPVTIIGLFITAYLQYKRGDQLL